MTDLQLRRGTPKDVGMLPERVTHALDQYTPPGGRIEVVVEREATEAVLRVRDNGIGIAPKLLPRIFDLFAQGETQLDRTQGGLGIGLTVVPRLVDLHWGANPGA